MRTAGGGSVTGTDGGKVTVTAPSAIVTGGGRDNGTGLGDRP